MYSLDSAFNELVDKIRDPDMLNPAKSDPELMLSIKKCFPRWIATLRGHGYEVCRISMAEIIWRLVDQSGRWKEWIQLEPHEDITSINEAVRDVLHKKDALLKSVADVVEAASQNTIVFVSDIELLHPFTRTKTIGDYLHDKAKIPTVFFYPGTHSGLSGLKFLGFHSPDPCYRSAILGG
jgi:hypothetical protein